VRVGSANTMPAQSGSRASKTSKADPPAPAAPMADQGPPPETGADPTVLDALLELAARKRQLEAFRERAEGRRAILGGILPRPRRGATERGLTLAVVARILEAGEPLQGGHP
jgi:hypothetical protein